MSEQQPEKDKRKSASGIMIPAGLFIGMGIGFAVDSLVAWMFIGLGVGFLGFMLVQIFVKD